ncbi:MAG TPA: extracellular solute-binding protein [Tepidisphaeraceae bacterium]
MRKSISILLLCLVLILPFVLRASLSKSDFSPPPNAKRLVIITANTQEIRRAFASAFANWYRQKFGEEIVIDYRVPGGANDIYQQLDTTYRAARLPDGSLPPNFHPDIDMVWGGGDYFFDVKLKRTANVLEQMEIDPALLHAAFPEPRLAGVKLYDYQAPLSPSLDTPGEVKGGANLELRTQNLELKNHPHPTPPPEYKGREQRPSSFIVHRSAFSPQPTWVGLCLSSMGIIYNPSLYQGLGLPAPKQWTDLTNEKLSGLVALADPSHSASVALAYMMVVQHSMADAENHFFAAHPQVKSLDKSKLAALPGYQSALAAGWQNGMETLQSIAANARYFTAWGSQVPNDVGSGDAAVGTAIDFYGRVYEEQVGSNRLRFVAPVGATSTTPDPIAILAGVRGEQYKIANRFIEFLLSPQAQRLWILRAGSPGGPAERSLRRMPIRQDVYSDQTDWTDHVDPFADAHGFNQRNDWMGLLPDMTMVWTSAWIDDRDDLRNAHEAIMRIHDPAQRQKLLADLARLPITMNDLIIMAKERNKLRTQPNSDLPGLAAQQDITLARQFREHYHTVQNLAESDAALAATSK